MRLKRAAWSQDGKSWAATKDATEATIGGKPAIEFAVQVEGTRAWFAWFVPYVLADARAAIAEATRGCRHATAFELARTRGGRPVPAVRIREPGIPDERRVGIWVQARQHPWELSGSWAAHGFLQWLVSDDPRAARLRQRTEIVVVPIMNVDGVEKGETMSAVNPNREWVAEPHYPEVAAAQKAIRELDGRGAGLRVFLDCHNYTYRGANALSFWWHSDFREGGATNEHAARMRRFEAACKAELEAPLKAGFVVMDNYLKDAEPGIPRMAARWVPAHCEGVVAFTLEFAVEQEGVPLVNPPGGQIRRGRLVGRTIERYVGEIGGDASQEHVERRAH
jgi:hypothetical protein